MHTSTIRLSLGPVVLLDWGDLLTAEPQLGWSQTVQEVGRARAVDGDIYARGSGLRTVSVEFARLHPTITAARAAALDWSATIPTARGTLYADVLGGVSYIYTHAVIADAPCALRDRSRYTVHSLSIRATGLIPGPEAGYLLTPGDPTAANFLLPAEPDEPARFALAG